MSSTNRGTQRNADDYYVTPHWLIEDFLAAFSENCRFNFDEQTYPRVLDPSAGGCEQYPMSYPAVLEKHGFNIVDSWDIREDSRALIRGCDFLKTNPTPNYHDLIITNPPFNKAQEFTEHALKIVRASVGKEIEEAYKKIKEEFSSARAKEIKEAPIYMG